MSDYHHQRARQFRPMLAAKCEDMNKLQFPMGATPKIDGIRCITKIPNILDPNKPNDVLAVSRSLKPIRNRYIQATLKAYGMVGLDGELIVIENEEMANFQSTTSGIMSEDGEPNFIYSVFDMIPINEPNMTYLDRTIFLNELNLPETCPRIRMLLPKLIRNLSELEDYEERCLEAGYEGVILRSLDSPYKFGRSTWREQYMVKIKRFLDAEATVVGFVELWSNQNDAEQNALGLTERSTHKENLVAMDTLGALRVRNEHGVEFNIGTGFTSLQRKEIWNNRDSYRGKPVTFKYQPHGVKVAPRCPVFLRFRPAEVSGTGGTEQIDLF